MKTLLLHLSTALVTAVLPVSALPVGLAGSQALHRRTADECPDYTRYASTIHGPYSAGEKHLSYQRPFEQCRTFQSAAVDKVIEDVTARMPDKDLARVFENAFPNTLDTTIRWHAKEVEEEYTIGGFWKGPQTFIVTGDINAEWLRDSTNQLKGYHRLAAKDEALKTLILGAINTQSEYVAESPYCNAFQPPPPSKLPSSQGAYDTVMPMFRRDFVFECKYELDSVANFLALGNDFYNNTKSTEFITPRWIAAVEQVIKLIDAQSVPTFDGETGQLQRPTYEFQRSTSTGTETLSLGGRGFPLNNGTGLVRSAFRPSDDSTILGYLIPSNAMVSVELRRTSEILTSAGKQELAEQARTRADRIEKGIWENGVVHHKKYGDVFAYEVDGYGSQIIMDDANVPSLLSLPLLGFVDKEHPVYKNTRKMILESSGNPYFIRGPQFSGIGGAHVGLGNAWPMSLLVQAMTSDDDEEIKHCLAMVLKSARHGLIHESVQVYNINSFSRSWFAWANSVYAQTILDLAKRKPHLVFGPGAAPYDLD